jgi:hypothetical protein
MNIVKSRLFFCLLAAATAGLAGCATTDTPLADGQSVKAIMAAQVNDTGAAARHGTQAPIGTDAEVANSTVTRVRERSREAGSRPGLLDMLLGGFGRN